MSGGRWTTWLAAVLAVAFLGLLGFGLTRDARELPSALVGREAPAAAGETLSGDSLSLGDLRGRVVVLNFWASWCIPCRTEHEILRRTERVYDTDGVRVVGVVYQDTREAAVDFMERLGGGWPSLRDPGSRIAIDYGVYGVPETFFISPDGVVARKHVGPVTWDLVRSTVDSLLAGDATEAAVGREAAARPGAAAGSAKVRAVLSAVAALAGPLPAAAQEADAVAPGGRRVRPPDTLPTPAPADRATDLSDPTDGAGPSGRELDDLTARVASRLRCPVCRSQSVLESSATLAEQMQREIRRRLAAGQSPEEVEAYFVSRYGEWILLQPEPRGLNLLVYLLPAAALLGGGLLIWNRLQAWTGAEDGPTADGRAAQGSAADRRADADPGRAPARAGAADAPEGPSAVGGAAGLSPEEEERVDALVREREQRGAG